MRVGLFIPCYMDAFEPEVGIATLELLESLGCTVEYPVDQTCCGQPMTNTGCHQDAAGAEALFVKNFSGYDFIVAPSGSCVHQVRVNMTAIEQTPEVRAVRERTFELTEFLHDILKVSEFPWARFPHKIGLHYNCNSLRGINLASNSEIKSAPHSKPRTLLEKVPGIEFVEPARWDECCGFGGTFSVFEPAVSVKMGQAHDERLWDMRLRRDQAAHALPEWEDMRALASQIKEHALAHLDMYLGQFEASAKANGVVVHWAADAAEHNRIVHQILKDRGAKTLIKSKSMLTDECGFRAYMAGVGVEVIETDLGERIQQLDGEEPSHVIGPAIHKTRADVAELFARTLGSDPNDDDIPHLASVQREATRPLILKADAGMTGCNFAVAETGTVVVCTNEGNADLSANTPPLHIASIGIEKIIPRFEHLAVFLRLLARNAIGTPMTQYTSHFRAPRAGAELHYVIVDNGRSERLGLKEFWTSLKCIRCGACMNTCPVYRRSGGLSYGATYSGPIGIILDPTLNRRKYSSLPFSSTLNGSCTNVCPVKINIHEQILAWRKIMSEEHRLPFVKSEMMKVLGYVLARPALYRAALGAAGEALRLLPHFVLANPLNTWTNKGRDMPEAPSQTFHAWWREHRGHTRNSP